MHKCECARVCTSSRYKGVLYTMTAIIRASMEAGPYVRVKNGCAAAAVQHRTPAPAASRVPAALLAVLSGAPDPAVGAHALAAAVAAEAPDAVMLADAGAPAVLAGVPSAVMLADACAPAVIASVPDEAFERESARLPATPSLFSSSSARSHTCESRGLGWRIHGSVEDTKLSTNKQHSLSYHHAFASPFLISPVNCCLHVWQVHHHLVLLFCLRRLNAAAKMGQTCGPSTRASGLDGRRARAQADQTHAILALADIIAKGNALVHFGRQQAHGTQTPAAMLKLLQSCQSPPRGSLADSDALSAADRIRPG